MRGMKGSCRTVNSKMVVISSSCHRRVEKTDGVAPYSDGSTRIGEIIIVENNIRIFLIYYETCRRLICIYS